VCMRRLLPVLAIVAVLVLVLPANVLGQTTAPPLVTLETRGSPMVAGEGGAIGATVSLAEPAQLRLRVVDFDGRTVRVLYDGQHPAGELEASWTGRDDRGDRLASGPYRIVAAATARGAPERAEAWVSLVDRAVYPEEPGLITVAVDPGHGRDYDGAVAADGTREADINLDVALRLARMLEGAGVNVALTRSADINANEPPRDRTGDGVVDRDDDLAARPDLANLARADLFLSIHNNWAVNRHVGGPSTLYFDERPFGDRSARLARIVQDEMLAALGEFSGDGWEPHDHGTIVYPYYVLRGYDPPRLRRPTQMPGVLSEGLFLSNERELALLQRPRVRATMALAYYEAVAKYLARRGAHVGYELVSAPPGAVSPGQTVTYEVEVRSQGSERLDGWRLDVSAVGAPARYVGRTGRGETVAEARIPRLAPGETATVAVEVEAPAEAREWMLVFDARDRDGKRAAALGSPALQVRLMVDEPAASPSPSASPPASAPPATSTSGSPWR